MKKKYSILTITFILFSLQNIFAQEAGTFSNPTCEDYTNYLDATAHTGAVWSTSGGATIINVTLSNTEVRDLDEGDNIFRWTWPNTAYDEVTVINNTIYADAGADEDLCGSEMNLNGNSPSPGTGFWVEVNSPTGLIITEPTLHNTTVTNLSSGSIEFGWSITNNVCNSYDNVWINITTSKISPSTEPACDVHTAQLWGYPLQAGETGVWTFTEGAGDFDDANLPQTNVNNMASGKNVYRWTVTNSGSTCSDFSEVSIDSYTTQTSNAGTDKETCNGASIQLTAVAFTSGVGEWSVNAGSAGTFTNSTLHNSDVSAMNNGINTYTWTHISNGACTPGAFDEVTVTNTQVTIADAGTDQSTCNTSANLTGNDPAAFGVGEWMVVSGTGTFADYSAAITTASGITEGNNVFRWTITNGGCVTDDEVTVYRNFDDNADAGIDEGTCLDNYSLQANQPVSGTGTWTTSNGSIIFSNDTYYNCTVSNLPNGETTFTWTIVGACSTTSDDVLITKSNSEAADAGNDADVCSASYNLMATAPSEGTGYWTVFAGSGIFANETLATTTVTGLAEGENIFTWNITICGGNSDDVVITRNTSASADAGLDDEICQDSYTLSGNPPAAGETGIWTSAASGIVYSNPSAYNCTVSNLPVAATQFSWTVTNDCGSNIDNVVITRITGETANAGNDDAVCEATVYTLNANNPTQGKGYWTVESGGAVLINASQANTQVTGLTEGDNIFTWTIIDGSCSSEDDVVIQRSIMVNADAGLDGATCSTNFQLTASDPQPGIGVWSASNAGISFSDQNSPTSEATNLSLGLTTFTWTVTSGSCVSNDDVLVDRTEIASSEIHGVSNVCANQNDVVYNVDFNNNIIYSWTISGGTIINGQNTNEINVNWGGTMSEAYIELSEINPEGCEAINNFPINIDITTPPEIIIKGDHLLICKDSGMVSYQWFKNDITIEGENKQFYWSDNLDGNYFIEILTQNNCLKKSAPLKFVSKKIKLYPNPASKNLQISLNNNLTGRIQINFKDLTGKIVKTYKSEKNTDVIQLSLSLDGINPGIYNLEVLINNKLHESKKLVIN